MLRRPAIERIWQDAVVTLGLRIERALDCFASFDGRDTLRIGADVTLDENDSLAQLVFHELCHALVQGPAYWQTPDWGLENDDPNDARREDACLRLQAHWSERHGLRAVMAPTTVTLGYYNALPQQPLELTDGPVAEMALSGWLLASHHPWGRVLDDALRETSRTVAA